MRPSELLQKMGGLGKAWGLHSGGRGRPPCCPAAAQAPANLWPLRHVSRAGRPWQMGPNPAALRCMPRAQAVGVLKEGAEAVPGDQELTRQIKALTRKLKGRGGGGGSGASGGGAASAAAVAGGGKSGGAERAGLCDNSGKVRASRTPQSANGAC